MSVTAIQIEAVKAAVRDIPAEHFICAPGGWTDKISIALIDAVYSGQQRYLSDTPGKGVYNRVLAFSEAYPKVRDDLKELVSLDESEIRGFMGDNVVSDGEQTRKSIALQRAAKNMLVLGVRHHHHLTNENKAAVKKAYVDIKGLGWVTFEYFLMLLGRPGIKSDTMIRGFVNEALKNAEPELSAVRYRTAGEILQKVYEEIETPDGMSLTDFDHTIWLWQRSR